MAPGVWAIGSFVRTAYAIICTRLINGDRQGMGILLAYPTGPSVNRAASGKRPPGQNERKSCSVPNEHPRQCTVPRRFPRTGCSALEGSRAERADSLANKFVRVCTTKRIPYRRDAVHGPTHWLAPHQEILQQASVPNESRSQGRNCICLRISSAVRLRFKPPFDRKHILISLVSWRNACV